MDAKGAVRATDLAISLGVVNADAMIVDTRPTRSGDMAVPVGSVRTRRVSASVLGSHLVDIGASDA